MLNTEPSSFSRRVSFDLSHNIVYLLPTIEECKVAAKERLREEWHRRSLSEDMLSEDIIAEIQGEWSISSHDSDEDSINTIVLKSCLKKTLPPPAEKTHKKKKSNHKKRKRSF